MSSSSQLDYLGGSAAAVLDVVHQRRRAEGKRWRFEDSKDFVDMPLRASQGDGHRRLAQATGEADVDAVLRECFGSPGSDLEVCDPDDWSASVPPSLSGSTERGREFTAHVHGCWPALCKRGAGQVDPRRHTLLRTPHKMFVPGSRFREQYYWDSYFILQGLLVSGLERSAAQLVENLLSCVERFGHVPNGTRGYYVGRTQPPLLSEMVVDLWRGCSGRGSLPEHELDGILTRALPLLVAEHGFLTAGARAVTVTGGGESHEMVRYFAGTACPRPESYKEDVACAASRREGDGEPEEVYREIATMAESGWDFSSRWLRDPSRLSSSRITRTVPVDLNTIVARMEANIARIAQTAGRSDLSESFLDLSRRRFRAIDAVMWDAGTGQWRDLVLDEEGAGYTHGGVAYASNWLPLWRDQGPEGKDFEAAVEALEVSGLVLEGGLSTSLKRTGHQWDYPNAWAPLQLLVHRGLVCSGGRRGRDLAEVIARNFVRNVHDTYLATGQLHEKYDAARPGKRGGGGEYLPQTGFGWTNGVVLKLLQEYSGALIP